VTPRHASGSPPIARSSLGPADLLDAPERALDLAWDEAVRLLPQVGALEAMLRVRVAAGDPEADSPALKAHEAAALLGVSERWLRRHPDLPFRFQPSSGVVRYDKAGLLKYRGRMRGG